MKAYGPKYWRAKALRLMSGRPWATLLIGTKTRAKQKGLAFELDDEWAAARWTGFCELTGLPFRSPEERTGSANRNRSPSIDRRDAAVGYTKANCRFVLWAVNSLKRDGTDEEMYCVAAALVKHATMLNTSIISSDRKD